MAVTITHTTPADGTFSATGAAAWDANHAVSGLGTMAEQDANNVNITGGSITGVTGVLSSLTVNSTLTSGGAAGQIMFDTGSVLQESSNLVWDNTNKKLTITGATVTTSQPVLDMTQTWNDGAVTFTGFRFNVTNTASVVTSLLMDLQVGGVSQFYVFRNGGAYAVGSISADALTSRTNLQVANNAGRLIFGTGGGDISLSRRGAANLRFGAADAAAPVAQTLSVQSVVAGTSNTAGANLTITGSQGTGTGAGGSIIFQVAPAGSSGTAQNALVDALTINSSRNLVVTNGAYIRTDGAQPNSGIRIGGGNFNDPFLAAQWVNSGSISFSIGRRSAGNSWVAMNDSTTLGWTSGSDILIGAPTLDLILTRRGAANLRFGAADAAAPVAQTLSVQSVVAGTSNTAGANLTITGSQGTGTGAGGNIIFQVAPAGSSGTAQNALTSTFTLNSDFTAAGGIASFTSNTTVFGGIFLRNTSSTGGGTSTGFTAQNDTTAYLYTRVYGSSVTGASVWGTTLANYSSVFSDGAASNGLMIGTLTADPIIFGTSTAEAFRVTSTQQIQIGSSNQLGWSTDLILTRRGAANLRLGAADAAAPVAQTLSVQSVVAGTSNTAGANFTITGSQGTGTGAGGSIIFQVAPAGSSGTAQNALVNALTIAPSGNQVTVGGTLGASIFSGGLSTTNSYIALTSIQSSFVLESTTTAPAYRSYLNTGAGLTSGTIFGQFLFGGSLDSGNVGNSAIVRATTTENWGGANRGSRIFFLNTANGSSTASERFGIEQNGLITFGGTTSSFPALKRSTTILQVRLADDSGYTTMDAQHRLQGTAPASATATGTAGDIRYDADYIYICTATDTWKRVAIATWP